ncbi:MAG TPA: AsmA family protein [Rhodanobacteraceae bacterium]
MPAFASWQRHRVRWIAAGVGIVVLGLLIALAAHVYALLQPQRFTSLLERDLASVGIKLEMQAPAQPVLFPRPGVHMQGFSLTNTGSNSPFLQASGATIVVPWRALLHGDIAIERIGIDAPRIDLGELKALFARLPHHKGPPRLPTIATGVHMTQGTLSNNGSPLLYEVSIDTGELVPGRTFQMNASARTATGQQIVASLATVPSRPHDGAIDFNPIELKFSKQGGMAVQLQGQGQWQGGESFALALTGTLRHAALNPAPATTAATPAGSGTTSAPANANTTVVDNIALQVQPASAKTPLTVAMKLNGEDTHADFSLQPTQFVAWWQRVLAASSSKPPGPLPFTGTAQVRKLDLGWLQATDLKIDAGPDLAPASAASTAAPAASTAKH